MEPEVEDGAMGTLAWLVGMGFAEEGTVVESLGNFHHMFPAGEAYVLGPLGSIKDDAGCEYPANEIDLSRFRVIGRKAIAEDGFEAIPSWATSFFAEDQPEVDEWEGYEDNSDAIIADLNATLPAQDPFDFSECGTGFIPTETLVATREETHGDFRDTAQVAQKLKDAFWENAVRDWEHFTAVQREGLDMMFSKLSRIASGNPHFRDHWDDIAGYAKIVAKSIG